MSRRVGMIQRIPGIQALLGLVLFGVGLAYAIGWPLGCAAVGIIVFLDSLRGPPDVRAGE